MKVLALDLATVTGWAVDHPDDPARPIFGTIVLPKPRWEGDYGRRFMVLRAELASLIRQHEPDVCSFEAPMLFGGASDISTRAHTIRLLLGFVAVAEEIATCYELDVREAHAGRVRKHFLGSAHGKRQELKLAAVERCRQLGWIVRNDNEADACAVWDYQRHTLRANARLREPLVLSGR